MGNRTSSPKPDDGPDDLEADGRTANEQNKTDRSSSSSSSSGNDTNTSSTDVPNRRLPLLGAQVDLIAIVRKSKFASGIANTMVAVHVWARKINNSVSKVKDTFTTIINGFKNIDTKALCKVMAEWGRQKSKEVVQWVKKNPKTTALIVVVVLSIIFGAAAPAMLGAIGFSAAGPVAGTIAAGWQASIGNVAAGSLFAILQSAAMGGFGVATVSLAGAGISFVGSAAVMALVSRYWGRDEKDGGGNGGDEDDDAWMIA